MSIRKNAISNFALQISGIVLPLVTFPYVTRVLSVTGYGKVTFIDAFTQYFIIFAALGIPYYGVREVARRKAALADVSSLVKELLWLNVTLSLFFCFLFIVLSFFIPALHADFTLVLIGCGSILSNSFLIEWYYQGVEKFAYITTRGIITKLVYAGAVLLFIKQEKDYTLFAFLAFIATLANAIINISYFMRQAAVGKTKNNVPVKNILYHVRPLLVLFSINISVSVYTILDTIILGLFTNPDTVSLYAVPLKLVKMYWLLINALGLVLIPKVTDLFQKKDYTGISQLLQKSMNIVFLLAIPFCFYCLVFPVAILNIISGEKYLEAGTTLRILSCVPLIIGLCNVYGTQFLLPTGLEKKILSATVTGLIVSLMLNVLLDHFLKQTGAAITCVAAELTVCIWIFKAASKTVHIPLDYSLLWHIAGSLLISGIFVVVAMNHFPVLIILFASACIYALAFVLLQFFYFKNKFIFSLFHFKKDSTLL